MMRLMLETASLAGGNRAPYSLCANVADTDRLVGQEALLVIPGE